MSVTNALNTEHSHPIPFYHPSQRIQQLMLVKVVIGPVAGIDTLSLHYLISKHIDPLRITIYMAHFEYLNTTWRSQIISLGVNVRDVEDAVTTRDRDATMTRDSDYDILRYRTEEEAKKMYGNMWWPRVSNTEMNERRRRGIVSGAYILEEEEGSEMARQRNNEQKKKGNKKEKKGWKLRDMVGKLI